MRDELLNYYERELTYLRRLGAEFSEKYPKIASRLQLEPTRCEDPHVERLIESFALLAARVHLKLDDEFPEITQALLNVVYPHYVRPFPSATVVGFHVDSAQGKLTAGLKIPRHSLLYSKPVRGLPCKFTTCYETTLWPLEVAEAQWITPDRLDPPIKTTRAAAALRLRLECLPDVDLKELGMDSLRFYLSGEGAVVYALYELLLNNSYDVLLRDPSAKARQAPISLGAEAIRPVGFGPDEALLPLPRRAFGGYQLLQEYFAFPEKFLFLDLGGLRVLEHAKFQDQLEVVVLVSAFERADRQELIESAVASENFQLGCSPAVNLFPQTAEPIQLDQTRYEYEAIPDLRHPDSMEVFSVDRVSGTDPRTHSTTDFEPFYSFRHATIGERDPVFYQITRRRPEGRKRETSEVYLTLVNYLGQPRHADFDALTLRCTCTNADLPSRLIFGDDEGDFEIEGAAAIKRIVALRKPTRTIRPTLGGGTLWRLVSHLSLNYLSLVEEGKEALQEILRLYSFAARGDAERQINGIDAIRGRRQFSRVISEQGVSYVRGVEVEMELDEEQFVGGGAYLFASVLERFLGQYVTLNSFSRLTVSTRQRKEVLKKWAPRAGRKILL